MSYPDAYIVEICMGGTSGAQVGLAQVGLGSDNPIDNVGTHWFCCNPSKAFGQKTCPCTADLSHATELFVMHALRLNCRVIINLHRKHGYVFNLLASFPVGSCERKAAVA